MLTLIVPTFRRPTDLLRCLASIQHQRLSEFELLVVDNAADPELADQVAAFNATTRVAAR